MPKRRKFNPVDVATPATLDQESLRRFIEPIRDAVQRKFFGVDVLDRTPSYEKLITLGLVTEEQVRELEE